MEDFMIDTSPEATKARAAERTQPSERIQFLTMEEAGELLRVSAQTIRRRIRSGELPAKRLKGGQTVLIDQADVMALLEDVREAA